MFRQVIKAIIITYAVILLLSFAVMVYAYLTAEDMPAWMDRAEQEAGR